MGQQFLLNFKTKPAYNAVDFFVSSSNETAYKWIQQWPHWPHPVLAIYGQQGCGKSHLAHVWQEITHANFYELETLSHANLEDIFDHNPCMIIDNIDHRGYEELLFHIYNLAYSNKGYVLLVCEQSPENWNIKLPDLRSRLNAIPKCKIEAPDELLRLALIQKLFTDQQITLTEDLQQFILEKAPSSFIGLQKYIEKICYTSFVEKKKISKNLLKKLSYSKVV